VSILKKTGRTFRWGILKSRINIRTFITRNPAFSLASLFILAILFKGIPDLEPVTGANMDRPFDVRAVITSLPEKSPYGYLLTLKPVSLSQQGQRFKFDQKIILKLAANPGQENVPNSDRVFMGDTILFRGMLQRQSYNLLPGIADRRITAENKGTPFFIRLKSPRQIRKIIHPSKPEVLIFKYLKNFIYFTEYKTRRNSEYFLRALLMGQKNALPSRVREKVNRLGITHLFVISGFHIGILAVIIHLLFRKKSRAAIVVLPVVIWVYIWMLGFPIPATRAAVIVSLFSLFIYFGIQKNLLNSLGIAAITLLILNPSSLFLPGFQLTFACLLGIIWLAVPLTKFLDIPVRGYQAFLENRVVTGRSREFGLKRISRTWIEDYFHHIPIWLSTAVMYILWILSWPVKAMGCTAAIQFFLFPILIYYFNCFNFISLPSTALFMPFITILVFAGLLLLILWWSPFSGPLLLLYRLTSDAILGLIDYLDSIFAPLYLAQPNLSAIIIYYLFLLTMLAINPRFGWIFPLLMLVAFFSWGRILPPETINNTLEISMLDVGQGECFHIRFPNGKSALIDAGGTVFQDNEMFIGKNLIARYLWGQKVKELDYLLISHPEKDHNSGYPFLDKVFNIKNLYYHDPHPSYRSSGQSLAVGDSFTLNQVHHQILWPEPDYKRGDNLNDRSLVLLMTYGHFRILFTGDISSDVERIILKKPELTGVKVLKVGHHGSNSSSCRVFLENLQAETAIASSGRNNSFGHPSTKVIKRLKAAGMEFYSTPQHGTVTITTDGLSWKISPQVLANRH
jgi:competence protein ComEC